MNTKIISQYIFLVVLILIQCETNVTNHQNISNPQNVRTPPNGVPSYELSDINNIVWTFDSYIIGRQPVDISSYDPFHLALNDSSFFGDDGCNRYGGRYELKGDTICPRDEWITMRACSNVLSFPWCHFVIPYRYSIRLDQGVFLLNRGDSLYRFTSEFIAEIDSQLLEVRWYLLPDTQVTFLFNHLRDFEAEYKSTESNPFNFGTIGGVYGLGSENKILFYERREWGQGIAWAYYLKNILNSNIYIIKNDTLILMVENDSTSFKFIGMK